MLKALGLCAPVVPVNAELLALRPLANDRMSFGPGFWQDRLEVNRAASLIAGAEELERAGNFQNFRVAAGLEKGTYRGYSAIGVPYLFLDSDIYKWVEAVSWEIGRQPSAELEELADQAITLLGHAQEPDGYLNSYFQITTPGRRFHTLVTGHELYNAGHLIQAGVAHFRATGKMSLLQIVERNVDCIYAAFVTGGNPGLPAHPGIEMALVELYRTTREVRYLELAQVFIDRRGKGLLGFGRFGPAYYQDHLPIRDAETITGHAVMALYLGAELVDAYVETGDTSLLRAAERQWNDLVSTKTYITGGVGSRYRDEAIGDTYELPPDRAYCETCASIASVMMSWRLLMVSGDGKYADLIERTLYNGVIPGVSLDGRTFFYANPLQVRQGHADPADGIGAAVRKRWFYCACCPPNVMRTFSSLEHLIATESNAGIQLHQYIEGTIAARSQTGDVRLAVSTRYPWHGAINITIVEAPGGAWELSLRVPSWAAGKATITVGRETLAAVPDQAGYLRISRDWQSGDSVALNLPMEARWTAPDNRVDSVRGCVALERGPLVYCFEHCDQPAGCDLDDVAVIPTPAREVAHELGGIVALRCDGVRLGVPAPQWPYQLAGTSTSKGEETTLTAIPYFAWANRERGAMRVWAPEHRPA